MDQLSYIPQQQRMAINNISLNKGGGNVSLVSIGQQQSELQSINAIVSSIRDDIKNIKDQFDHLPPVPEGQKPPTPLARFQNSVNKIEQNLNGNVGLNNQKVWPATERRRGLSQRLFNTFDSPTPTDEIQAISKNVRTQMTEQKVGYLTRDPENVAGHNILREKYSLPLPNSFKYGRSQGGISNIELEKLGIGTRRPNKVFQPKRILPKNFRDDPFADPPPITENDIKDGMYSLLNRGIIPRDVDLSPAFERGKAPFTHQQSHMDLKDVEKPPQWKHKVLPGPVKYLKKYQKKTLLNDSSLPDPETIPEVNFQRDHTFLTAMNVENNDILRTTAQRELLKKQRAAAESNDVETSSAMKGFQESGMSQASRSNGKGNRFEAQSPSPSRSPKKSDELNSPGSQGRNQYQVMVYDENAKQSHMDHQKEEDQIENNNYGATSDSEAPGNEAKPAKKYANGDTQFLIDKGVLGQDSAEFQQFKRENITQWGAISQLIYQLEKFLAKYIVKFAYISASQMLKYANLDQDRYSEEDLIACITNQRQVLGVIKNPKKMYKGNGGPAMAAVAIQKTWRYFKAYSNFRQLKFLMDKATIIQRRYRLWQLKNQTQKKLKKLRADSIKVWGDMQNEFSNSWASIRQNRRIEIHINSFTISEVQRMSIEKFKQKENMQIARIFSVKDPNVDVIYICPYPLTNEIYNYYLKILELVEIDDPESRFHVIVPENYVKFPRHLSLTQALLYSPKAMKSIKKIIEGQQCYIVPGKVSEYDIRLSVQLSIPIITGDPQKTKIFSTKSGAKRIFQMADVPVPIGAHDIYNQKDFFDHLTKLIASNLYINTWIFKIDDEFNGRGHASLAVDAIKTVVELRKRKVQITEAIAQKLQEVIEKTLPKKVKMAMPSLYRSWDDYFERFCQVGGVIEAAPLCSPAYLSMPSVSFFIEPNGDQRMIGSFDRIEATQYVNAGCFFPQTSLPSMNLVTLSKSIGDVLYSKGLIGHVTVDLISFPNPQEPSGPSLFWAVDISAQLSDNATICLFFDILMEGKLDPESGEYEINSGEDADALQIKQQHTQNQDKEAVEKVRSNSRKEPRNFMYCNFLHHPGLSTIQYRTFFHMCRLEQISFDMEKRQGTTFTLYDSLQSAVMGLLCIGVHRKIAVSDMIDALNFVQNQAGVVPQSVLLDSVCDSIQVHDVVARCRLINRAFESRDAQQSKNDRISFIQEII